MSYDISFKVRVQDTNYWVPVGDCDANITWNVRDIIKKSTGLEWKNEQDNGLCTDVIPMIKKGWQQLKTNGDSYKKYEPENGWGSVNGTIRFFERIIKDWQWFANVYDYLVDRTHFWIE